MTRGGRETGSRSIAAALLGLAASLGSGCAGRAWQKPSALRPAAGRDATNDEAKRRAIPLPFALAAPEDAVVRVVTPDMTCSGTLFEDDRVLTAHHCVVRRTAGGGYAKELVSSSDIHVELGGDYLAWGQVDVRAVIAPPCGEAGGEGDLAILVLTRKVIGLATIPVRLGDDGDPEGTTALPKVGERLDPIGFGRCGLSGDAIRRRERKGGTVRTVTRGLLTLEASICPGDSGGPAIGTRTFSPERAATAKRRGGEQARESAQEPVREIVGVISLSAMDFDEKTRGLSYFARLDSFRGVFDRAEYVALGGSASELPPLTCEP